MAGGKGEVEVSGRSEWPPPLTWRPQHNQYISPHDRCRPPYFSRYEEPRGSLAGERRPLRGRGVRGRRWVGWERVRGVRQRRSRRPIFSSLHFFFLWIFFLVFFSSLFVLFSRSFPYTRFFILFVFLLFLWILLFFFTVSCFFLPIFLLIMLGFPFSCSSLLFFSKSLLLFLDFSLYIFLFFCLRCILSYFFLFHFHFFWIIF